MECSRRQFVRGLGMAVVMTACGGTSVSTWGGDPTTTTTSSAPPPGTLATPNGRTLVILELGGGNDGLNTVVPHADPTYRALRPGIGIDEPLDLDGEIGLHPALGTVAAMYGAGSAAIVEGVGYPTPSLSHFNSMDTWWTAAGGNDGTGWIGRYLDGSVGYDVPTAAVSVGPGPSRALLGAASYSIAIQGADGLTPSAPAWVDDVDELVGAWKGFIPMFEGDPGPLADIRQAIGATLAARDDIQEMLGNPDTPTRRVVSSFTQQLETAATLATSETPPQVIFLHGAGDFDTHQGQLNRHGNLLAEVDAGVASFFDRVDAAGRSDEIVLMTTSEFGRRAGENGDGTDHGTAAPMLVLGSAVKGGRYGEAPSLTDLDPSGNLRHTVDFRSTYATVLSDWLEADATTILGGEYEQLGFLT